MIPCLNAGNTIGELLGQLGRQTLSPDQYEVIVVDDGSTDDSCGIVRQFPSVTLLEQSRCGPGEARNLGSRHARGDLVLYLDSDLHVHENLLEVHLNHHVRHPDVTATGGSVLPFQDFPPFSWALVDHLSSWFMAHPHVIYEEPPEFLPSLNFCVNRRLLIDTHEILWDDGLHHTGEDVVYCHALRRRGLKIAFVPEAVVLHQDRRTAAGYLRHMYRWGFHAPFVRGTLPGLKYGFLFPQRVAFLPLALPAITLGYTLFIWKAWLRARPLQVTLCLPQIFFGRLAYAWGVVQGTIEKKFRLLN